MPAPRRTILITGCAAGLGEALAHRLYGDPRYRCVITAREKSIHLLRKAFVETENFWIRTLDVTNEEEIDSLINEISVNWGGVDVLINNAGISYRSVIEHMDEETELHQLKTNYLGPMALARMVLPTMREKRRGHIVNISSVSGMLAMPTMGSYSASKHALEGATESLWYEMRPFGIHVSVVQPGFVRSESHRKVLYAPKARVSGALEGPYSEYYASMAPFVEKLMERSHADPAAIARAIVRLIERRDPPLWYPVTRDARLFGILRKLMPRIWFHKLMFRLLPGSMQWGRRPSTDLKSWERSHSEAF